MTDEPTESPAPLRDEKGEAFLIASQWRLMWWKFRKHKPAVVCSVVLILFYLMAVFCEFVSPSDPRKRNSQYIYVPAQRVHFFAKDGFHLRPFVYRWKGGVLDENWTRVYETDTSEPLSLTLFVKGDPYKLFNLIPMKRHLFGLAGDERLFLLGADHLGRDLLSRVIYGARVSLSVGLIGVLLSLVFGCIMGGISGYFGGRVDTVIQRIIETLMSLPTLPLWMGLGAALPPTWSPLQIYFGMILILSVIGWTGLARVVRGKILSLREEDFAMAARLAGASEMRIIRKHLLPSFYSYLIVSLTLSVPGMILAETTLSYLGLGLRPPVISWGVLLQQAQDVQTLSKYPWMLTPAFFVIAVVLSFNFVGDGMRDAADPYTR
ncbi:MAG: ABC transporter permease [Planctomycetota bacterium]